MPVVNLQPRPAGGGDPCRRTASNPARVYGPKSLQWLDEQPGFRRGRAAIRWSLARNLSLNPRTQEDYFLQAQLVHDIEEGRA